MDEDEHVLLAGEPPDDNPLEQIVRPVDAVAEQELCRDGDEHRPVEQTGDEVVPDGAPGGVPRSGAVAMR